MLSAPIEGSLKEKHILYSSFCRFSYRAFLFFLLLTIVSFHFHVPIPFPWLHVFHFVFWTHSVLSICIFLFLLSLYPTCRFPLYLIPQKCSFYLSLAIFSSFCSTHSPFPLYPWPLSGLFFPCCLPLGEITKYSDICIDNSTLTGIYKWMAMNRYRIRNDQSCVHACWLVKGGSLLYYPAIVGRYKEITFTTYTETDR